MQDLRALGKRVAGVMPGPECSGTERAGGAVGSQRAATLAMAAIFLLLTSQLGGCATKVAARQRPPVLGPAGNSWELVLESPSASAISYAAADRPELSRRNETLNLAVNKATLANDRWPEDPRPNLRYDRRISLPRDDRSYLYFDRSYERSGYRSHYRYRIGY